MHIGWEETPLHKIDDGEMVRVVKVGKWDSKTSQVDNPFMFVQIAIERCSVRNCGAIRSIHPLALKLGQPHEFF